jgi:hypothetical protein
MSALGGHPRREAVSASSPANNAGLFLLTTSLLLCFFPPTNASTASACAAQFTTARDLGADRAACTAACNADGFCCGGEATSNSPVVGINNIVGLQKRITSTSYSMVSTLD